MPLDEAKGHATSGAARPAAADAETATGPESGIAAPAGAGEGGPAARLAGAIYGTILVMSVITAKSAVSEPDAAVALIAAVVTSVVFWFAHVYADALAAHIHLGTRRMEWHRLREIAGEEWPMVQSVAPPGACLLLGIVGLVSDDTAILVALAAGVVALAVWGSASARRSGASPAGVVIAASVNVALGLVIVGLKLIVH